jgi:hypothetical protein
MDRSMERWLNQSMVSSGGLAPSKQICMPSVFMRNNGEDSEAEADLSVENGKNKFKYRAKQHSLDFRPR